MKKLICLLIAALMLLTACSNNAELPTTEETMNNIYQQSDPAQDDVLNILMIGNSGCYYYVEELHGMLAAVGIKANVCNVYYNGCKLSQHWTWWKTGESKYDYFITNDQGRVKTSEVNLEWCLQQQNWDVISLHEGGMADLRSSAVEISIEKRHTYLFDLTNYLKEQFPYASLYWQQPAAYQVGYNRSFTINTLEDQQKDTKIFRDLSIAISKKYNVGWIPRGDAAILVREGGYDNLCARLGKGENNEGDYYHDGDWGGGQFLTASVWFECLTGQSCIGNTYRPVYTQGAVEYRLEEDLVTKFQAAAHQAVANRNEDA
ncbi:MAG: DUF4886 domain-containing protein [Oscillospiraceae bacterium]|nr:DUF4886 domain-containing protein [Oscillospiraceae bacterium]